MDRQTKKQIEELEAVQVIEEAKDWAQLPAHLHSLVQPCKGGEYQTMAVVYEDPAGGYSTKGSNGEPLTPDDVDTLNDFVGLMITVRYVKGWRQNSMADRHPAAVE